MELFASIGGHRLTKLVLMVPPIGCWFADGDFDEVVTLSGKVTINIGTMNLVGTVVPAATGSFGKQTRIRIVGGANGWATSIKAKSYHADNGVKALIIAQDAAREVGETIGTFTPPAAYVGADYARRAGSASHVIEDVLGTTPWWVDYNGVTQAGPRPATPVTGTYEVLQCDPREHVFTVGLDDPAAIQIGSTLSARLESPETVREMELTITGGQLRITCWGCPMDANTGSRLERVFKRLFDHFSANRVYGLYAYRVFNMNVNRVALQAASSAPGLPDILPVTMMPGAAGSYADLTPGAIVYVQFLEGDPTKPVITNFGDKSDPGFVPKNNSIDANTLLELGKSSTTVKIAGGILPVARQNDPVIAGPYVGTITGPCSAKVSTA